MCRLDMVKLTNRIANKNAVAMIKGNKSLNLGYRKRKGDWIKKYF